MGIRAIAASAVCWLAFMVTGASAQVANPGCETAGTPPPSWTQVSGNWSCGASASPPAHTGVAYFLPGYNESAELRQDIPVSHFAATIDGGLASAEFLGYVRSFQQGSPDRARIVIEYRDAANASVLSSFDSGNLSSVTAWSPVADTRPIPAGTRTIRISLISTRRAGQSNDGYYDDLSLSIEVPKLECHADAGCRLEGCDDCSCIALAVEEPLPKECRNTAKAAACRRTACVGVLAACQAGECVLRSGVDGPRDGAAAGAPAAGAAGDRGAADRPRRRP